MSIRAPNLARIARRSCCVGSKFSQIPTRASFRPFNCTKANSFTTTTNRRTDTVYAWYKERAKQKNESVVYYTLSLIIGTVAIAYGSVPMYKMTGWGGQPIKATGHGTGDSSRLTPVTDAPRIRITFNSSVSDILPWKFTPQQREVRVLPGETALAFFTARNTSEDDIIGVATYSVTPGQVAPYFNKIQCFCFEEQRLEAGETVDMPVFFYIDPEFAKDPAMRGIETVTLAYTFFKARYDKNGNLRPMPMAMG